MNFRKLRLLSETNKLVLKELKNVLLVILILIDFIMIFVISIDVVSPALFSFMADFDLFVCFMLFLNLLLAYHELRQTPKQFLKSHIIDILSIIPLNFIFLRYLAVIRLYRIIQLLQIFQLLKIHDLKIFTIGSISYFVQNRLLKILTVIMIFYVVISTIVLNYMDPALNTIFQAFWFNIATLTGVGYGDVTPSTISGKIIAIMSILIGVFFISIFTAAMSALYMRQSEEETKSMLEKNIQLLKKDRHIRRAKIHSLELDVKRVDEHMQHLINLIGEQNTIINRQDRIIKEHEEKQKQQIKQLKQQLEDNTTSMKDWQQQIEQLQQELKKNSNTMQKWEDKKLDEIITTADKIVKNHKKQEIVDEILKNNEETSDKNTNKTEDKTTDDNVKSDDNTNTQTANKAQDKSDITQNTKSDDKTTKNTTKKD